MDRVTSDTHRPGDPGSPGPAAPLLDVRDLWVRFELDTGPLDVVKGVDFSLHANEILCLVGESGSGKTVTMHAILGLNTVDPGIVGGEVIVHFDGEARNLLEGLAGYCRFTRRNGREYVVRKPGWRRRYNKRMRPLLGRRIGLIFQNPRNALDPLQTVGRQLEESIRHHRGKIPDAAARKEALTWLERVRIDEPAEVYKLYPHQLSGGMCQRVAIAQILALHPDILIADEPTTGLDATIQVGILELIKDLQRNFGLSVIVITHDFEVVERIADRIMVLFFGRLLEVGRAEEILGKGAVLHPYTRELVENVRVLQRARGASQVAEVGRAYRPREPREEIKTGCNFYSQCPIAALARPEVKARCQAEEPPMVSLSPTHRVRCHEWEQLKPGRK